MLTMSLCIANAVWEVSIIIRALEGDVAQKIWIKKPVI